MRSLRNTTTIKTTTTLTATATNAMSTGGQVGSSRPSPRALSAASRATNDRAAGDEALGATDGRVTSTPGGYRWQDGRSLGAAPETHTGRGTMTAPAVEQHDRRNATVIGIFLAGAALSILLGVYGDAHTPTGEKPYTLFFSDTIQLKVWFATVAVVLAVGQVLLALRIYGKLGWPRTAPPWLGDAHRLCGTLAFIVTVPVAYQCLWALGFQSTPTRVLVHSLAGCLFYGAFLAKVLAVRVRGLPGWSLPVLGGLVFTALVAVFLTSSVWFFTDRPPGLPLF
jgi:hypothetical protein